MYPRNFIDLFPAFPRTLRVFVAMSFEDRFKPRWETVIKPGITKVSIDGNHLDPFRVDIREVGDSVLTEILEGISTSLLVIADITSIGLIEGRPQRNSNVLYELGIAHAIRLPEEVLIFRSDNDSLLFDVSNVRVNLYDPDNHQKEALDRITGSVLSAIKERDLRRHLAVRRIADMLDVDSWSILGECQMGPVPYPTIRTMRDALSKQRRINAIHRLLEVGAIKAIFPKIDVASLGSKLDSPVEGMVEYRTTEFGTSVFRATLSQLGVDSLEVQKQLQSMVDTKVPDK